MGKGALGALAAYWPEDTARYAHVPLKRVGEITVHAQAKASAERTALVSARGELAYGALSETVKRLAAALRGRAAAGARVALALADPAELVAALFAAFENEMLAWPGGVADAARLSAFAPDLVVGEGVPGAVTFAELLAEEGSAKAERPDYKKPLLALARPGGGEVLHNHKTLAATAISVGSFYMLDAEARVLLLEPPGDWLSTALMLGTLQRGGSVCVGWGDAAVAPERVDYAVGRWPVVAERWLDAPPRIPRQRIGAGVIAGVEGAFSVSHRRRLARRIGAPVLTVLGRSDLGPAIASHPSWFLEDAVGIPMPNVDTRPLNPADGTPLNIGWDSVESAEIGVKSALAPAGATVVAEGWLRSGLGAEIDPTGLYFLRA